MATPAQATPNRRALGWRLQRLAVRTGEGPLRPLWDLAHGLVILVVTRWIMVGSPRCLVYLKGGFGFGRAAYGLSDVDTIVVAPDRAGRERIERRWQSLAKRSPTLDQLFQMWIYDRADVDRLEPTEYLTFGLGAPGGDDASYFGEDRPHDPMGLLDRPGLYGVRRDWRRLGAGRRAPLPIEDPLARDRCAWLELRNLWGLAYRLSALPPQPSSAYTSLKLVSDSARVWMWLEFGEQGFVRERLLHRALERMPEEEPSLRRALALKGALPQRPAPALGEALRFLMRTSARVAELLQAHVAQAPVLAVKLTSGGPDELMLGAETLERARQLSGAAQQLLPLADWRARALPGLLDLALAVAEGDPSDPEVLRELAGASDEDLFPAVRQGRLLLLPTTEIWHRGRLRGVETPLTDPVSFALLDGDSSARFVELPGWSAADSARRAVAEHRAWLASDQRHRASRLPHWMSPPYPEELAELCGAFSAARAALFAGSIRAGSPELLLTAAAVGRRLADVEPSAGRAAAAACEELARCRPARRPPDRRVAEELRGVVEKMPAYVRSAPASGLATFPG